MGTAPKRQSGPTDGLFKYARDLQHVVSMMGAVAEAGHDSMSMSQALIFLSAAAADLSGRPTTMGELREDLGPLIGKSIHTTYGTLLENNGKRPAIGWLRQEENPNDRRFKFLRLTPKGRGVIAGLALGIDDWKEEACG